MNNFEFFLRFLAEAEEWQEQAACRGEDLDFFFPKRGQPTAKGRALCAACPVHDECDDYAKRTGSEGLWAGRMRTYSAVSIRSSEQDVKSA